MVFSGSEHASIKDTLNIAFGGYKAFWGLLQLEERIREARLGVPSVIVEEGEGGSEL